MRCAIDVAPLGDLADPHAIVRLAVAAEAAGWDGVSTWDSLGVSMGAAAPDPFVTLAAVASATTRVQLILSVVALPRHRPQLVAQAAATDPGFAAYQPGEFARAPRGLTLDIQPGIAPPPSALATGSIMSAEPASARNIAWRSRGRSAACAPARRCRSTAFGSAR